MTAAVETREQWVKGFSGRDRASGSILDFIRITPPAPEKNILPRLCSPGWTYTPGSKMLHRMNCKRRACLDCGWYWAYHWRQALAAKAEFDFDLGKRKADKALTLTFAENVPYLLMQRILEWFWEHLRRAYPGIQYWGVVEFNQAHTIPHLHFILANAPFLDLDHLDFCWKAAQKRAKLEHLAWNLRIEKIRKNTQAYFTKYITKLLGGKDEIPRRENWQGRFVRYSKGFFPISVPAMLVGRKFAEKLKANDDLDRVFWHVRKPLAGLSGFMERSDLENALIDKVTLNPWEPVLDKVRGICVNPPDLFTNIDNIPVYYEKTVTTETYKRAESYNRVVKSGYFGPAF